MVSSKFLVAVTTAGLLASGMVLAEGAKPNDAQIAHIAYTAGQIDIEAAEQAKQKSKNKDVLAFAADMERDHKAVSDQALALVKKLGVTPQDNDTSKALSKQAADKRAELSKLSGKEFDKAYIGNEVAYHKAVDSALQNTLIPGASNAELKELLTTGLKIFRRINRRRLSPFRLPLLSVSGRNRFGQLRGRCAHWLRPNVSPDH